MTALVCRVIKPTADVKPGLPVFYRSAAASRKGPRLCATARAPAWSSDAGDAHPAERLHRQTLQTLGNVWLSPAATASASSRRAGHCGRAKPRPVRGSTAAKARSDDCRYAGIPARHGLQPRSTSKLAASTTHRTDTLHARTYRLLSIRIDWLALMPKPAARAVPRRAWRAPVRLQR